MIRILFFSEARNATGLSEISLALEEVPDVRSLWQYLIARYPKLLELHTKTRLARNSEFISKENEKFSDGEEIALIPPVSGG